MWNKIMKKVQLRRVSGPFYGQQFPLQNFVQSPIGLVLKVGNLTRLIFHLSFDFGEGSDKKSVNHYIPDSFSSLKYHDLDCAVKMCLKLKMKK